MRNKRAAKRATRRPVSAESDTRLDTERVREVFDREALARVCTMPETAFAEAYGLTVTSVEDEPGQSAGDFFAYRDNGASVLAVAHLDTVGLPHERGCHFMDTSGGEVVYSRALDDRLGAYITLDLLPLLDVKVDVLLTVGEEMGRSTAAFFNTEKEYDWMIEYDRGGTDVVMYQYEDRASMDLIYDSGARVGDGSFSDICYLEHLQVKGFNWGVGYHDEHHPRAHAYLDDTYMMVGHSLAFHRANAGHYLPHTGYADDWPDDTELTRDHLGDLWEQMNLDTRRLY